MIEKVRPREAKTLGDDRYRAMLFQNPHEIPVTLGLLPAVWMKYREQIHELSDEFPHLFSDRDREKIDYDALAGRFVAGDHLDAWGCVWSNTIPGMTAIVTGHPLPDRSDVNSLEIPDEDEGLPHGFMYLRLADLRGFEQLMLDFAEEPPELKLLIDKVLEYNLRQAGVKVSSLSERGSIVYLGDDLGMQTGLPIHPSTWRTYLVDIDLDRQLFPFASKSQLDEHVHETVETLKTPSGGLWMTAHIDQSVPLENIRTICELLTKYRRLS